MRSSPRLHHSGWRSGTSSPLGLFLPIRTSYSVIMSEGNLALSEVEGGPCIFVCAAPVPRVAQRRQRQAPHISAGKTPPSKTSPPSGDDTWPTPNLTLCRDGNHALPHPRGARLSFSADIPKEALMPSANNRAAWLEGPS